MEHGFGLAACESGDAVVAFHTAECRVVPGIAKGIRGKFTILHLGFL